MTVWRYVEGGAVKHVLHRPTDRVAVCGMQAGSYPGWLDDDGLIELAECGNCARRARR